MANQRQVFRVALAGGAVCEYHSLGVNATKGNPAISGVA
jgi:hypothetical protein